MSLRDFLLCHSAQDFPLPQEEHPICSLAADFLPLRLLKQYHNYNVDPPIWTRWYWKLIGCMWTWMKWLDRKTWWGHTLHLVSVHLQTFIFFHKCTILSWCEDRSSSHIPNAGVRHVFWTYVCQCSVFNFSGHSVYGWWKLHAINWGSGINENRQFNISSNVYKHLSTVYCHLVYWSVCKSHFLNYFRRLCGSFFPSPQLFGQPIWSCPKSR